MMTYKETLFFIGKCLTISHEEHNKKIIEQEIKSDNVDWDNVVKLSTAHYVFPALYCNLKRANFLQYLPDELVNYMKHITDLNRERNQQIIAQAKEINELLLTNNITPIFLKGTGNLLEGLYEDIAERMVGDIDFIVSKVEYQKTINLLLNHEYLKVSDSSFNFPAFKHYPRLFKKNSIAAVEIHKELTIEKYASVFNYELIIKNCFTQKNISFLGYNHQLCLSIIAKQINDYGVYFKNIALRNGYDVFLLSKKTDCIKPIENLGPLFNPLTNFIAICNYTLGEITTLQYKASKETDTILAFNRKLLNNDLFRKKHFKRSQRKLFFKTRISILFKSFCNKEIRGWLFERLTKGRL